MLNFLLDTHVVLWWLEPHPPLAASAYEAIANGDNLAYVSAAAVWEIAIKRALGKLDAPEDLLEQLREKDLPTLAILPEHAWEARLLPPHHSDPFDRLLIAQALVERITILTADPVFGRYGCAVMAAR